VKLQWKSPVVNSNYSPTNRSRWPPTKRQILTAVMIVIVLVSLSLMGYFFGWWSAAGQYPWVIGLAVAIVIAVVTLIILISLGYQKKWTGFGDKTLWNWFELLIVPAVLTIGGFLFAAAQENIQQQAEERRAQAQMDAEEQRAQHAALQAYLEGMGSLLLDRDLRSSEEDDEVRTLAEARTSTVLSRIEGYQKRSIVLFLYKAKLIQKDQPIVPLVDADLSKAHLSLEELSEVNLSEAYMSKAQLEFAKLGDANLSDANLIDAYMVGTGLSGANLSSTYLSNANLFGANLFGANLSGAYLGDDYLGYADLGYANLSDANLYRATITDEQLDAAETLEGATMPDGSKHD
jgi:uncharacterized protein YjbI with pentapeptide repeats